MDNLLKRLKCLLPTQRRLIQLYVALLYNAHIKGFIKGNIYTGSAKVICVPGLNCYSCPGAIGACPLGALQNAVASSEHRAPVYVLGIIILYGLILGRTICGCLCPFGLLQELLHKIPTPKVRKNRITRLLSWLKYIILLIFVIAIPLSYAMQSVPLPAFCKYICPAGTAEGAITLLAHPDNADKFSMLGALFTNKFLILLLIIGTCVFVYRAFCRFLCPLGAIYSFFAKVAVIGVKVDINRCVDCDRCIRHCKMDIHHVGDHECIHCGECIDVCPTSAIMFKAGKYTIAGTGRHEEKGKLPMPVKWGVALVLLILTLVMVNQHEVTNEISAAPDNAIAESQLPIGKDVGMRAPNFTAPMYGNEGIFDLAEHPGKIVVINFWATWCTPCINELPHFGEILRQYSDDVIVVALHSNLVTEDVKAFLAKYDYDISFALDATGEIITSFGGSAMLPQTVILDRNGVITYNAVGSLTYGKLHDLVLSVMEP